jgi:hypothetical protein
MLPHRTSIVDRLAARSATGQSLDIRVHQHIGYRVHFEWDGGRATERRSFMYSDAQTFCIEHCKCGLEGVWSCNYRDCHSFIPAKNHSLSTGTFLPTQKYCEIPKWWIKSLKEMSDVDFCECNVSSRATLDWHWTPKENPPLNEGPHLRLWTVCFISQSITWQHRVISLPCVISG